MNGLVSRFQFRPALTIAMLIALGILVMLGNWQLQRLQWKNDLIAKTEARVDAPPIPFDQALSRQEAGEDMAYTPVSITGVYTHDAEAHVFGTLDAKAGYYIFTPLRLERGVVVYVNRGFVPQRLKHADARPEGLIAERVTVTGLFRAAEKQSGMAAMVQPADQPAQNEWHQRNPVAFAEAASVETAAAYIDSNGAENSGDWPRGGTTRLEFNNRHLEYALTWFGLAGALLGVWFFFSLRKSV